MNVQLNRIGVIIAFALGSYFPAHSQQQLPTLEVLLATAVKYSPLVKTQQAAVLKQEAEAKRSGKLWTQSLQFEVGTRYYNSFSSEGSVPMLGSQSGISIRISLYDLFAQKNINDRSRYEVQEAQHRTDQQEIVIKQSVVNVYYQATLGLRLLEIASERVQSSLAHKTLAEHEFKSGDIQLSELARIDQIVAQSKSELEKTRASYDEACRQLEVLVGVSLTELNK